MTGGCAYLHSDSKAAVYVGEDATSSKRAKTDARHAILLQEAVESGLLRLRHWPGNNTVADMLTNEASAAQHLRTLPLGVAEPKSPAQAWAPCGLTPRVVRNAHA